jgi:hypothetical protein
MRRSASILLFLLIMALAGLGQKTVQEKNDSVFALVKKYLNEKAVD